MAPDHDEHLRAQVQMHETLSVVYSDRRYASAHSMVFQRHWNRRLCDLARIGRGMRVLDLGSGVGIMLPDLAARRARGVALDVSWAMLRSAAAGHPGSLLVCADAARLPFRVACFDRVVCRGSIHHVLDRQSVFEEAWRVLWPGGVLAFSEPSNDSLANRLARRLMYRRDAGFHEEDEGFRRKVIIPQLEAVGFAVEASRGFGFLAYTLAGFPDKLDPLANLPGKVLITRFLILVDSVLESLPLIHRLALHWQLRARKLEGL